MDSASLIAFASESIYLLVVFGIFFILSIWKGRQFLINFICGLYLTLLSYREFPYFTKIFAGFSHENVVNSLKLLIFFVTTVLFTLLMKRLMPSEYQENRFESFPKKFLLATVATLLVLLVSFSYLPVGEFLSVSSPIQDFFASEKYRFILLVAPLAILIWN